VSILPSIINFDNLWFFIASSNSAQKQPQHKNINTGAMRTLAYAAKPYHALQQVFKSKDPTRLPAEIAEGIKVWDSDGNLGLVQSLVDAYQRFAVLGLQGRFATYPLSKIDNSIDRARALLEELVASGDLEADIVDGDVPYVRFLAATGQKVESEAELQLKLATQLTKVKNIMHVAKRIDQKMMTSEAYVAEMRHRERTTHERGIDFARMDQMVGDTEEEDIMDTGK